MEANKILDFIFVQYYDISERRTIKWIHVLNYVRLYAIASELWAINGIQNGGRRHLEFITIANFNLVTWPISYNRALLQNYINLTQTRAEILVFVQKSKMTTVAILDLFFVQYYSQFVRRTIKWVHMPIYM